MSKCAMVLLTIFLAPLADTALKCAVVLFPVTSSAMFRGLPAQAQTTACGTITVTGAGDAPGGGVGTASASAATGAEDVAKFNACERAK